MDRKTGPIKSTGTSIFTDSVARSGVTSARHRSRGACCNLACSPSRSSSRSAGEAASSAVSVSYLRLRTLLTRQLGLAAKTPDAQLAQAAEQRLGWKDSGLANLLGRAEASSRMEKLSPRQALDLVQNLERHAARLSVRPGIRREKT